jgi:hypothetical protein
MSSHYKEKEFEIIIFRPKYNIFVSIFKHVLFDVNVLKCILLRHNMWTILRLQSNKTSFLCKSNDLVVLKNKLIHVNHEMYVVWGQIHPTM